MKKPLRKWALRMAVTGLLITGLLAVIILNPILSYANRTERGNYTIYHNAPLDIALGARLEEATQLVKSSVLYNPSLRLDICLSDGSYYPDLIEALGGKAFGRGFYNKVVLMAKADYVHNYATINGYRWNLSQLLAHEMIHCYQLNRLGIRKSNPIAGIPDWKWEGYPEYIARQSAGRPGLEHNIQQLLQTRQTEHNGWIAFADSTGTVIRYYESWLLMQYCMDVRRMSYDAVLRDTTAEAGVAAAMMRWYSSRHTAGFPE